jgi:hypothetical protein
MPLELLSLRAYALRRGVSAEAVSKAVASGRLHKSVTRVDGRPKIVDPELADREWAANTRSNGDRPEPAAPAQVPAHSGGIPDLNTSRALRAAAAARRETALADLAELDVAERRGQVVDVDEARADVIAAYSVVKTRLLGVPSRVAQRLPDVAARVVPVVDELIREALEELAADDGADHGDA